jgi:RluA family pseudouridine synthase
MKFTSKVPSNVNPETGLIDYLSRRFTYHTTDDWRACINNGQVFINSKMAVVDDNVSPGSELVYDAGEFDEPPANLEYRIIYEDEWFLGIDKPGNLLVHRAGRSFRNNLIYQIRYVHTPPYPAAQMTHRLDRDTSGVVLVAKGSEIRAVVSMIFAKQQVSKQYRAIVHGIPDTAPRIIDAPIGKMAESRISYKFHVTSDGKPSQTEIVDVEPLGEHFSVVTVKPITGRTHQIRIHLAFIGHPLVGDKLYGMSEHDYLSWRDNPECAGDHQLLSRHALHCERIEFMHPYTDTVCRIESALPEDMCNCMRQLKNSESDV